MKVFSAVVDIGFVMFETEQVATLRKSARFSGDELMPKCSCELSQSVLTAKAVSFPRRHRLSSNGHGARCRLYMAILELEVYHKRQHLAPNPHNSFVSALWR